jgi:hypothetical protein
LKKIVYVPSQSKIRLYKIAKAVKLTNQFELLLVCPEAFYDEALFEGIFDKVVFFTKKTKLKDSKYYQFLAQKMNVSEGLDKMVELVKKEEPDIIHTFCEPYTHIEKLLKETNFPVVMTDGNDFSGISFGVDKIDDKLKRQEQFCFENVKGLIYKGPKRVTDYYRSFGYKINCEELTWLDHTDEDLFVTRNKNKENQEIHMVFTGTISKDPERKYCYYIPLAKELAKQKIHFHVYPTPYKPYKEYLDLDKNEEYFHFHKSLPMKELIDEISTYDWGLWIHAEDPSIRTTIDKIRTGIGNKLFSYLEAGLPIIASDSRIYGSEFVKKHELGFSVNDRDWNKLDKMISKYDIATLKEDILAKRKELSLQSNKGKIVELYHKLM